MSYKSKNEENYAVYRVTHKGFNKSFLCILGKKAPFPLYMDIYFIGVDENKPSSYFNASAHHVHRHTELWDVNKLDYLMVSGFEELRNLADAREAEHDQQDNRYNTIYNCVDSEKMREEVKNKFRKYLGLRGASGKGFILDDPVRAEPANTELNSTEEVDLKGIIYKAAQNCVNSEKMREEAKYQLKKYLRGTVREVEINCTISSAKGCASAIDSTEFKFCGEMGGEFIPLCTNCGGPFNLKG